MSERFKVALRDFDFLSPPCISIAVSISPALRYVLPLEVESDAVVVILERRFLRRGHDRHFRSGPTLVFEPEMKIECKYSPALS